MPIIGRFDIPGERKTGQPTSNPIVARAMLSGVRDAGLCRQRARPARAAQYSNDEQRDDADPSRTGTAPPSRCTAERQ